MNKFLMNPSFAFKRKCCLKRIESRQLAKYKECVQQIMLKGRTEINGQTINSIADLTVEFYGCNNTSLTSNYFSVSTRQL